MLTTTTLFVEILIIGIGAFCWLFLLAGATFGYSWAAAALTLSPYLIPPVLALTYVFGSIIDRIADTIFHPIDLRFQKEFFDSEEQYVRARTWVYEWSSAARNTFEYSKSRIRVCRGWTVNAALLLISTFLFIFYGGIPSLYRIKLAGFLVGLSLFLLIGSYGAWYSLSRSRYFRLECYYDRLLRNREKRGEAPRQDESEAAEARSPAPGGAIPMVAE